MIPSWSLAKTKIVDPTVTEAPDAVEFDAVEFAGAAEVLIDVLTEALEEAVFEPVLELFTDEDCEALDV